MGLQTIRNKLEQIKGNYNLLSEQIQQDKKIVSKNERSIKRHEKAREVVRLVGLKTQEQLQYHISDITTMALDAIFTNPYKLEVEFVHRRNKTECDIYFSRDGNKVNPKDSSGGGAVDVAAFALRIASWSLEKPNKRNTIILDEPTKWISKQYREKVSAMLKEVSKKLGLQFIIVSHDPTLADYADKTFTVTIKNGVSKVDAYINTKM